MNGQPHTHKVEIRRRYGSAGGCVVVTYGDTTVRAKHWWETEFRDNQPSRRLVDKAIRKAIRRHDAGSQRAQADADRAQADADLLAELSSRVADLPPDRWASEVFK